MAAWIVRRGCSWPEASQKKIEDVARGCGACELYVKGCEMWHVPSRVSEYCTVKRSNTKAVSWSGC